MKQRYVAAGGMLAAALAGAPVLLYGGQKVPAGQPPLRNLTDQNVAIVEKAFNAAQDDVRVLVLFSPT
jgi:hypothetical protein